MLLRTQKTLRKLTLCASVWLFCIASIVFDLPHVIAPMGHEWVSLLIWFYWLWQCGQWFGAILLPLYMAVNATYHSLPQTQPSR